MSNKAFSTDPADVVHSAGPRHVGGGRVAQVAVVRPDDDARARRVVPLQVRHQVLDDLVEVLVPDVPGHLLPAA